MVINIQMITRYLKQGYKPTNEKTLFKTWLLTYK